MAGPKGMEREFPSSPDVRELEDPEMDADERTQLLGNSESESGVDGPAIAARKGSWNAHEDFAGLPWWRKPSVSVEQPPVRCNSALYSQLTVTLAGFLATYTLCHIHSSIWGIIVPKLNL